MNNEAHVGKFSHCYIYPHYLSAAFFFFQSEISDLKTVDQSEDIYSDLNGALCVFLCIHLTKPCLVFPLPSPFSNTKVIAFIKFAVAKL